jgi:hypothetical protein
MRCRKGYVAEIAKRLGRKALEELAVFAKPDTLLAWYRKLIADKFDGSRFRQRVGGPRIDEEAERLISQMAKENPSWGYDRIVGLQRLYPFTQGSFGGDGFLHRGRLTSTVSIRQGQVYPNKPATRHRSTRPIH